MAEHKWADVLRAIADKGMTAAQCRATDADAWFPASVQCNPLTHPHFEWRIKPEPKPDVVCRTCLMTSRFGFYFSNGPANLRLVWDGEDPTKLKSAEVLP